MNIRSILLVALMLVAKTYYLYAQDQSESPYFFIPNEEADVEAFPLLQTEADVNIVGVIADVRVTQLYQNTGKEAIEAIYVFPASTNAAVYGMQMIIGKRVVYAKIKEKNEAQQIYNKAKEEGKSASLLEQHRPNVFQMSVANIMPGDQVKVELFYTEMLVPQEGIYEFVYPTVVGPRYASQQEEDILTASGNWNANPYLQENEAPGYSFDINVYLRAGIPIRDVACNSHSVKVDFLEKKELKVCLDHSNPQLGNKDFVLQYRLRGEQIENGLLLYEGKEENFFLMMMQPPKRPKVRNIPAREYIFIMDVSGSMNGYPLDVSKKMMGELLGTMQAKDRFNILYFAGGNSFLSETSLPPTQQNIQNALQGLNMQRGSGGTEMMSAVKRAMSVKKREGMSRSLVILTDGYISAEAEVFDYIRNHLDEANFFAFGIGNGVNRHLIEGIAHAGFSDPFVVMEPETAAENANKFKAYIQTPVLTNLSVDFKGMDVYDMTPARLPDLMGERPILLFGKYRGEATDQWTISGENAKGKFSRNISFTSQDTKKENAALQYLWARHRLKTLSDFSNLSRVGEELKAQITDIGLKYNLLTPYTSFVAVNKKTRNQTGKNKAIRQPLPLPEGVENSAIGQYTTAFGEEEMEIEVPASFVPGNWPPAPPPPPPPPVVEELFSIVESMPHLANCKDMGNQQQIKTCTREKLIQYIADNLKYPPHAKNQGIEGIVVIQFTVASDGSIQDIRLLRDIGAGCGKEALRLVREMTKKGLVWIPGKQRGVPVNVQYNLPIKFKLEK